MNLKNSVSTLTILFTAAGLWSLAGCAEMESNNTKSLLSASGFHTLTPQTALQKQIYAEMPSYSVQRVSAKGKTAYVFKDEKAGIAYVGHEAEYQRYRHLCIQQQIAQQYYMAASMDYYHSRRWYGAWGHRGMWW